LLGGGVLYEGAVLVGLASAKEVNRTLPFAS
jgi:hypothetical protein